MRLLLDAHVGRAMTEFLRTLGNDVLHVNDLPTRLSDSAILQLSQAEQRVVITSDKDFGALVFHRVIPAVGVLLIRYEASSESQRLAMLQRDWLQIERLVVGRFVVATNSQLRASALPGP
jgi:predicted nuclease of predicted toxin-antitoxin system